MINLETLYESTKHLARISTLLVMKKTKLGMMEAEQVRDELLELRFARGIVEDTSKIKYGRQNKNGK